MNSHFAELAQLQSAEQPGRVVERLIEILRDSGNYHQLFDASLLQKKLAMGIQPRDPSGFDDIPESQRAEFEQYYVESARKVGQMLLDAGNIGAGWVYFRTIREPEPVVHAIESYRPEPGESPSDEIIELALYQGLAPAAGLKLMLEYHGTCTSITALDQGFRQFTPDQRRECAALMVTKLYRDLRGSVALDLERRHGQQPPEAESLAEIVARHPELFENDNYHIDVSHLNAVVRFARALSVGDVELGRARELTEYGQRLAPQYQYASEPPFDRFYPAHNHYFSVLLDDGKAEGLRYFQDQLASAGDENSSEINRQLAALALLELLVKINETGQAAETGVRYLAGVQDQIGISLGELCLKAGRTDLLAELARNRNDLVAYTMALIVNSTTQDRVRNEER